MKLTYLGLGSNIGDREANLRKALERLEAPDLRVLRVSPVYETEPMDYADQRWFLNAVVEAETELFPRRLLSRIGKIERALGRVRNIPSGPRTIDIDILFYGAAVVETAELQIPHSRIVERRFVLAPLADLAPELRHPAARRTVKELLEAAPAAQIRRLEWELRPNRPR